MKAEKKEIVKYDNHFNLRNINKLDQIEMDVFFACISQFTKKQELAIELSFKELQELSFLSVKKYGIEESMVRFEILGNKVTDMKFWVQTPRKLDVMTLFNRFSVDFEAEKITIEMNPAFAHYFFDIPEKIGFSQFELEAFVFLRSKYAKNLFRCLLHHFTGKWTVNYENFKITMGFPDDTTTTIVRKTLNRIIPELENTGYFSDIEFDYTYKKGRGRPVKDIIFSYQVNKYKAAERAGQTTIADYDYTTQTEPKTQLEVDISDPLRPVAVEKTVEIERKCPYCGEGNIISRTATGEQNKGRKYEKCEFNDRQEGCCRYFKWLDD